MSNLKELAIKSLIERGVSIDDIADIVYTIQKDYYPNLSIDYCKEIILLILEKDEVINAILTGIALDKGAEEGLFSQELNRIIVEDNPLFGIDEIMALSIVNTYGSIALTNFGYVDKLKPLIIGKVDKLGKTGKQCNTFLDDIVGALAAAGASKIAHGNKEN